MGDVAATVRVHGGPDEHGVPLHDFSTNSNACGPCPAAQAAVRGADASRYPDACYTDLRRQLAAFHGVDAHRVLPAASASEFIFRITAVAAQQGARCAWLPPHCYGDYADAARANGLALETLADRAQLLWACEPASPLGTAQSGVEALLHGRQAGDIVVLDRAYEPLRLGGAPSLAAAQLDTVWQLWTPNKALGLTGVRAAYAIAPENAQQTAAALGRHCPSWPVGAHGVALLQSWTSRESQEWLARSRDTLRAWKVRQIELCESLGWRCIPSEANFFCAQPALREAMSLAQMLSALRAQGIKLRDAASFGLPGHVRVGVQAPLAQDALRSAWRHIEEAGR